MKITIIYGNARKGSTYHCVQAVKEELSRLGEVEFTEFTLPRDLPHFCAGCFNCFFKGEDKCPHAGAVQPVAQALDAADGIILASPSYALEVTGALKALFDHLCYMWISHRPRESMFAKTGLVIATTAGAGAGTAVKTMKKNLKFWGVKRRYGFGTRVAAASWEDVKEKKKEKIEKKLMAMAGSFYRSAANKRPGAGLFIRSLFAAMRNMQKSNPDDSTDKRYWKEKGWLNGARPF
jgi:multimeric flavodoxin WrbA